MRARRLALGIGLALLLAVGWLVVPRRARPSLPETGSASDAVAPSAAQAPALLDTPPESPALTPAARDAQPPAGPPASDGRVAVRSALGLALERVEIEQADGRWREEVLDEGALHVPEDLRPLRVRASGHRAAELAASARELVLEPHTSLVLTSFPSERVKEIDPFASWDNQREAAQGEIRSGSCGPATWAIAFDASRLRAFLPHLDLAIRLDDGTEARLSHELESGRHDVYAWPRAPLDVRTAMLAVEVERSGAVHGALAAEVHAYPDSMTRAIGSRALWNEQLAWGRFVLMDYLELVTGRFDDDRFELGPLVLGKRYVVTVRDETSGDHDRRFFVHDGTSVLLRLAGGLRLRGTIDVAPALPLDRLERIVWSFGERPDSVYWRAEPHPVPVASDGSFQLVLPDPVPHAERAPFPRPTALALELRAGGFEARRIRLDTAGRSEIDLGTVELEPLPTQLVLASGHDLAAEDLSYCNLLVADSVRNATVCFSVAGAQARADGALAVALARSEEGEGFDVSGPIEAESLPWPGPDALVLEVDGDGVPFRRGPDGGYLREPTRAYRLALAAELPPASRSLIVRWEWEGIFQWVRNWPPEAFEQPQEWTFTAPLRDARLRWSLDGEPWDAHPPAPLSATDVVLRVP